MTVTLPICLTKKTKSLVTILTVISYIFILFPFSSAISIDINSPSKIPINQDFSVSVSIDIPSDESYEIKLFVNSSSSQTAISEILSSEGWKKQYQNAKYYFSYPEDDEFTLRVFEIKEDTTLCVYLKTSPISKSCVPIEIESLEETNTDTNKEEKEVQINKEITTASTNSLEKTTEKTEEVEEPIILNSKTETKTIYTKEHKTRTAINYALVFVSFLLLFFIATNRI